MISKKWLFKDGASRAKIRFHGRGLESSEIHHIFADGG
jgi:hypothetical protein